MFYMSITFLSEEDFQQLQQSFMEKHYLEFEDSDENKLSYTPIFNEYVSCWASHWGLNVTPTPVFKEYDNYLIYITPSNNAHGCCLGRPAGETPGAAADGEDPWLQHEHFHRAAHVRCDITTLPWGHFILAVFPLTTTPFIWRHQSCHWKQPLSSYSSLFDAPVVPNKYYVAAGH